MSCYEEERGEFKLPSSEFSKFRRAIANAFNEYVDIEFAAATVLFEKTSQLTKGMRGRKNWGDLIPDVISFIKSDRSSPSSVRAMSEWELDRLFYEKVLLNDQGKPCFGNNAGPEFKIRRPLKKSFPHKTLTDLNYQVDSNSDISFDPEERTVVWNVDEGNRSVEAARKSHVGKAFFNALKTVQWTRGTGGCTTYINEYMRESAMDGPGCGGSSSGTHMGPIGEAMNPLSLLSKQKTPARKWRKN